VTVFSIQDRITGWMADQIGKEDPLDGDDWGHAAAMQVTDTAKGPQVSWRLLMTLRGPFLGQAPIGASIGLMTDSPPEQAVRHFTAKMMGDLRQEFGKRKTNMVRAPGLNLPGGLTGLPGALKQGPN
jgi:hypothetical protein